jgi:hypothetical protein
LFYYIAKGVISELNCDSMIAIKIGKSVDLRIDRSVCMGTGALME